MSFEARGMDSGRVSWWIRILEWVELGYIMGLRTGSPGDMAYPRLQKC